MPDDKITRLRIEGMRCIEKLDLALDGLTVLVGDNGTGKSTIIEACELLRCAASKTFARDLDRHGGVAGMLRAGSDALTIGARIEGGGGRLEYTCSLRASGGEKLVRSETLDIDRGKGPLDSVIDSKNANDVELAQRAENDRRLPSERARRVFDEIEVHVPFETTPRWAVRQDRWDALPRSDAFLSPARRLDIGGANLVNAYQQLKNSGEAKWRETMDYVRLGLGQHVDSVETLPTATGGRSMLSLRLRSGSAPVPASQLSDGQLAYLSFVALLRLETPKSLLAFDEPELHLHPELLIRVLHMLSSMSEQHPVLIATHSDRLLDALPDPAQSVVVLELDEKGATTSHRLDGEALAKWLKRYRGVGDLRGAGHFASVVKESPESA